MNCIVQYKSTWNYSFIRSCLVTSLLRWRRLNHARFLTLRWDCLLWSGLLWHHGRWCWGVHWRWWHAWWRHVWRHAGCLVSSAAGAGWFLRFLDIGDLIVWSRFMIKLSNYLDVVRVDFFKLGCGGVARQFVRNSQVVGSWYWQDLKYYFK